MRRLVLSLALLAAGCSGEDAAPAATSTRLGCDAYVDADGGVTPGATAVSLERDVMPQVFALSCAFGSCHAVQGSTQGAGLYLGPNLHATAASGQYPPPYWPPTADVVRQVHEALVQGAAATEASMPRVTPGDPARSFLMHKLDQDQNASGLACHAETGAPPCGDGMPGQGQRLPDATLELVRAWICQGAKLN